MLTPEIIATREKTLAAHLDGETRKDVDSVLATFSGAPVYDLVTVGKVISGHDEVRAFLQLFFDSMGPNTHLARGLLPRARRHRRRGPHHLPGRVRRRADGSEPRGPHRRHLPVRRRPDDLGEALRRRLAAGPVHALAARGLSHGSGTSIRVGVRRWRDGSLRRPGDGDRGRAADVRVGGGGARPPQGSARGGLPAVRAVRVRPLGRRAHHRPRPGVPAPVLGEPVRPELEAPPRVRPAPGRPRRQPPRR